ncbi:MAG: sigma-54-dependent Fis family transcriptional regulator, partial [Planctomycetes bacterium]|nr:sigma-54-dependent Fis family transcriptional regulator [Planctomycetota bacterium]
NVVERAIIFSEGELITVSDLGGMGTPASVSGSEMEDLQSFLRMCEREHLNRILDKYERNKSAAAKALGVGLSSLYRKLGELGVGS